MKKILRDPSIWLLLATNVFILEHYLDSPGSIYTVIVLFWIQSVLIGLFNTLDIFTAARIAAVKDAPDDAIGVDKTKTGSLFLLHYGIFHAAYFLFIKVLLVKDNSIDWNFVQASSWFLLAASATGFVRNKIRNRTEPVNLGNMFLFPYARILPMHFVILVPAFFNVSAPVVFIILKILTDILMYILYQKAIFGAKTGNTAPL
jgi:hypothetical protein